MRSFVLDKKLFNPQLYSGLIKLWFGDLPRRATQPDPSAISRWFGLDESTKAAFDGECYHTCGDALRSIGPSKLTLPTFVNADADRANYPELASPFVQELEAVDGTGGEDAATNAALGLTLLLDQVPRNVFRDDQALIYQHYDRLSRAVSAEIRARQLDVSEHFADSPPWRSWFYMPLEHSESAADQDLLLERLADLRVRAEQREGAAAAGGYMQKQLDYAEKHAGIIRKFGRFPHRNKFLGRETTAEETAWLEGGGDTFGT